MTAAGRKRLPAPSEDAVTFDQPKIDQAMGAMRADAGALVLATAQHEATVRATADQVGYMLPADSIEPEMIMRDIRANMRRSVEACLEVGRGLLVLKAVCGHGNFLERLDALALEPRVAQKFMAAARRFSNASSTPLLVAAGNQTKLFELLVLDDDQVQELELLGQTGELALDDVASMSTTELRKALRETRAEKEAVEQVLGDKNRAIDKLKAQQKRIERLPADEEFAELQKEAVTILNEVLGLVRGSFRQAIIAIGNHGTEDHTHLVAGMVGQVQADLNNLRNEFNLPDVAGDGTPEWQRWAEAEEAKKGGRKG